MSGLELWSIPVFGALILQRRRTRLDVSFRYSASELQERLRRRAIRFGVFAKRPLLLGFILKGFGEQIERFHGFFLGLSTPNVVQYGLGFCLI